MIDRRHALPIVRQAKALNLSRGCVYYLPRPVSPIDLALMRRIDELHLEFPFAGSRMLRDLLNAEGIKVGRLRTDPRTKAYVTRRVTEGHTKLEAIRCVKRYIAREVFSLISQRRREINQLPGAV